MKLLELFAKDGAGSDQDPREASTRSAGAQPSEGRRARQHPGAGERSAKSEGEKVTIRLRRPIVEAVEQAVKDSPIEFGNVSDFYRRAIEHELARRGLLKTYK